MAYKIRENSFRISPISTSLDRRPGKMLNKLQKARDFWITTSLIPQQSDYSFELQKSPVLHRFRQLENVHTSW